MRYLIVAEAAARHIHSPLRGTLGPWKTVRQDSEIPPFRIQP